MADFFIKRPILSICLSVIIVLLGAFSILRLPISEYPDIIPPSIQVTATYPGADCETVVKSIASPHRTANVRRGRHVLHDFRQHQQRANEHDDPF